MMACVCVRACVCVSACACVCEFTIRHQRHHRRNIREGGEEEDSLTHDQPVLPERDRERERAVGVRRERVNE